MTDDHHGSEVEPVAVCIVTYDSADDLPGCLDAVAALDHRPLELIVVDCASSDASVEIARTAALPPDVRRRIVALDRNVGFSGGMNRAYAETRCPHLLSLNPDARPEPDFVRLLVERWRRRGRRVGALTGRLVRPREEDGTRRLDACGMRLTRSWRHLDRGSGQIDRGQWHEAERVFGATGAASLFVREALADVSIEGLPFDPDFHSYREDAELAFRLQERGWDVIYEPRAVAEHRRRVVPKRRRQLPAEINFHSLKNRYLLRAYHQTASNLRHTLVPTLGRDALALLWVLSVERSSLRAYRWLWRQRRRIAERRRLIQSRRTVLPREIDRWFSHSARPL